MPGDWLAQRWFDPYRDLVQAVGAPADVPGAGAGEPDWLAGLNRLAAERGTANVAGRPIRFEPAEPMAAIDYETRIATTGRVPTRVVGADAWHDYFNALVWLRWPASKARLNALQLVAIAGAGDGPVRRPAPAGLQEPAEPNAPRMPGTSGPRGRLRDMLTLFDESAAILFDATPGGAASEQLRAFAWQSLFVDRRETWGREVSVVVFGHALLQKLRRPYKSICAQGWTLCSDRPVVDRSSALVVDPDRGPAADPGGGPDVDQRMAESLSTESLLPGCLTPLPLLGVPGWWPANGDPAFYADPQVFRAGRRGATRPR